MIGWVSMPENKLFEAVANLVLQSVSVWEDLHLYALAYSIEYNAFWGLLDDDLKSTVCAYRKRNREERLPPFTMNLCGYYRGIINQENYNKIVDQHWKKQLRIIINDNKFRIVMSKLNLELKSRQKRELRYLQHPATERNENIRISTRINRANAGAVYNTAR